MKRDLQENLSYIIRTDGELVPAMPDDGEFSTQEIRDYVAGIPESLCETHDGYILFHSADQKAKRPAINRFATSLYLEATGRPDEILGRAFLAHPDHVPTFMKTFTSSNSFRGREAEFLSES